MVYKPSSHFERPPPRQSVDPLLRSTFAVHLRDDDLQAMSHEDWVHVRSHLSVYRPEDIPGLLAGVLLDLLHTHRDDPFDNEDAEYVIAWLNRDRYVSADAIESAKRSLDPDDYQRMEERDAYLRNTGACDIAHITAEEACAIYTWLLHARDWQEWKHYQDDYTGALGFWKERCST